MYVLLEYLAYRCFGVQSTSGPKLRVRIPKSVTLPKIYVFWHRVCRTNLVFRGVYKQGSTILRQCQNTIAIAQNFDRMMFFSDGFQLDSQNQTHYFSLDLGVSIVTGA